jgi:hypothetical protein
MVGDSYTHIGTFDLPFLGLSSMLEMSYKFCEGGSLCKKKTLATQPIFICIRIIVTKWTLYRYSL